MKGFSFVLASILALAGTSIAEGYSVAQLRVMNQVQLNAIYNNAPAGTVPKGDAEGTAVFFPGTGALNIFTQELAAIAWQGKIFDTPDDLIINKVFGFNAILAKIYYAKSFFDGKQSIILDYSKTSILANRIRDEIREVAPGVYLGRAYLRAFITDIFLVNFILDFTDSGESPVIAEVLDHVTPLSPEIVVRHPRDFNV